MNDPKPKALSRFSLRLPDELRARIQAEAEAQRRTESNMIKAILEEYFDTLDRPKKIAERR
jgi:predicted DNA-binding protein